MEKSQPDYKRIYSDIIERKYPEKYELCSTILQKKILTSLDIVRLNQMIFGLEDKETSRFNQMHKSYDRAAILEILEYQKKSGYNNVQLASQFKISRNSITKWKRIFT